MSSQVFDFKHPEALTTPQSPGQVFVFVSEGAGSEPVDSGGTILPHSRARRIAAVYASEG